MVSIVLGDISISVPQAKTNKELSRGLMFQESGRLLLSFKNEGVKCIWMPFMKFSIDAICFDAQLNVVQIIRNMKPITFNPKTWLFYYTKKNVQHILEVESGFTEKNRIEVGQKATLQTAN